MTDATQAVSFVSVKVGVSVTFEFKVIFFFTYFAPGLLFN